VVHQLNIAHNIFPSFDFSLPLRTSWNWTSFEQVDPKVDSLRGNMFILTGKSTVKIVTMYPGKINPISALHNRTIKLQTTKVVEEVKKWDGENIQHVIETKEGVIHEKKFFQNVFVYFLCWK